jgi:hypothetical protein
MNGRFGPGADQHQPTACGANMTRRRLPHTLPRLARIRLRQPGVAMGHARTGGSTRRHRGQRHTSSPAPNNRCTGGVPVVTPRTFGLDRPAHWSSKGSRRDTSTGGALGLDDLQRHHSAPRWQHHTVPGRLAARVSLAAAGPQVRADTTVGGRVRANTLPPRPGSNRPRAMEKSLRANTGVGARVRANTGPRERPVRGYGRIQPVRTARGRIQAIRNASVSRGREKENRYGRICPCAATRWRKQTSHSRPKRSRRVRAETRVLFHYS